MMGRTHVLSAAAAWTTFTATTAGLVHPLPARVVFLGGVVCAGSAILPDWDCPGRGGEGGSHAARSLGWPTQLVARGLAALSRTVYRATATARDRPDGRDGHRGLTHTVIFAATVGALISAAGFTPAGPAVAAVVLFLTGTWAARAVLPWRARRIGRRWRVPAAPGIGAVCAAASLLPHPGGWGWLGAAVALGAIIHDLGDTPAHHPDGPPESSGVALFWPIRIRGQRWYRCHPPVVLMFPVGGTLERGYAAAFTVAAMAAGGLTAWVTFGHG